jgi:hypothetical protein
MWWVKDDQKEKKLKKDDSSVQNRHGIRHRGFMSHYGERKFVDLSLWRLYRNINEPISKGSLQDLVSL